MTQQPLLPPSALADALGAPDLAILDIRSAVDGGGRAAYEAGHVPVAIHTDYVADGWRMAKDGAGGLLPDPETLAQLFGRLGLTPESRVAIAPAGVSSGDFSAAARVYWTLKTAGHRHLAILDGGFARWAAEGRPVETGAGRQPAPTSYPIRLDASRRATLAQVEQVVAAAQGGPTLLDTRGPKSFVGEEKSPLAKRAGRLPGEMNLKPPRAYAPATNRLRPRPELEQFF